MEKIKLILATNNLHKVEEIESCIGDKFDILTLDQLGFQGDIEETGNTLEENSLLKASFIWEKYKVNCLADDSGLEVASLNGAPGVISARYAGAQRNHDDNMNLLLDNLVEKQDQSAQFRTVITLIIDGKINQFEGIVKGQIINEKRGKQGFGYDPIFVPVGFNITFAEMTLGEKNNLSHRSRALQKMIEYIETQY
jgi:XTP/dITP diphosphohydrolase